MATATTIVVNGTTYEGASMELARALEDARGRRVRVRLEWDEGWGGSIFEVGYIGRSTGRIQTALLVHNKRSLGGPALGSLDHLKAVRHANKRRGGVIWERA